MNIADFRVDTDKCVGCGKCVNTCVGGVIYLGKNNIAVFADVKEFGWNGCWQCEHCLAVCPTGAISIFGHSPKNSLPPPIYAATVLDSLIANRHSCRRYVDRNVEKEVIEDMISRLANAPNGGNKQQVEFTLIDEKEKMNRFRESVSAEADRLAKQGIFPDGFDKQSYEDMKRWQETVRPDMFFCGAPHILIPHAPVGRGEPLRDTIIAATYFELLCASRGLGAVMLTFPLAVLDLMPEIKAELDIPENHCIGIIVGFGYPEISYARGVQKSVSGKRIHRPKAYESEG